MPDVRLESKARSYARWRGFDLMGSLGDGTQGNVWHVENKNIVLPWALKMHLSEAAYRQERDCYERLSGIVTLAGFHVPRLLRAQDEWLALEMTIVSRPYVLDFGQAFLDRKPDFSEEVWNERYAVWSECYGDRWPEVKRLLWDLESHGIYYLDVHRGNIATLESV